ncbi:gas vesicle protein GvpO [Arthrobacter pigmenti]
MADDETTTRKRPSGDSGTAKRQTRKTGDGSAEGSGESNQPAKRSAPKRPTSAEKSASGSGSKTTNSQESASSKSSTKSDNEESATSEAGGSVNSDGGRSGRKMNTARAAREAMDQLQELTNRDAEGIVGIEKNDDGGWTVTVEVVEGRRIPNTADVLAEYSVTVDSEGDLTGYSRLSRYVRGRATRGE